MPRPKFSVNSEIFDLLCQWIKGEIDQDTFDEKVDELASYRNDVTSSVDDYYRQVAN